MSIPTTVVKACGRCGQRNRIPISSLSKGRYVCGACGATIAGGEWPPAWLAVPTALWIVILLAIGISNVEGPEKWWFGAGNLYMPQIVYALPAIVFIPAFAIWSRRWIMLPVVALLFVVGPLMGFVWNLPRDVPSAPHVRVMTFNAKWGKYGADRVADEIRAGNPDIVQFQDSVNLMDSVVAEALVGYNVRVSGQYVVASKFPMSKISLCLLKARGYQTEATRVWIRDGNLGFALYDVHLLSPRPGLVAFRRKEIEPIISNTAARVEQSQEMAWYLSREQAPAIVTGDLNSPVQGLACRNLMDIGYRDAFEEAGRGYGYTYGRYTKVRSPYVRIDHILVTKEWRPIRCWTGGDEASEHVPVLAVLAYTGSPGR